MTQGQVIINKLPPGAAIPVHAAGACAKVRRPPAHFIQKRGITKFPAVSAVHFSDSLRISARVLTMTSTALPLLRSLLREARHINDYNFRSYAIRRVKAGFDKNRNLAG